MGIRAGEGGEGESREGCERETVWPRSGRWAMGTVGGEVGGEGGVANFEG